MQFQRQSFIQQQRLGINPQLYQSLKLMEMPVIDLRERIEQELETNPALELLKDRSIVRLDETESRSKTESEEYSYFEASSDPGNQGSWQTSEDHQKFIEGVLTRPETLREHLLWQLQLEPIEENVRSIAETLIQNLDDDGFHIEKPETLFKDGVPKHLDEAMDAVRGLEPAGTCTSGYRESLLVQLKQIPEAAELITDGQIENESITIVLDNLELLKRGKYSQLAKKTGLSESSLYQLFNYIKKLSPFPGRSFTPGNVRYVIPDLKVIREKDEFTIMLNDEAFPVLGINPFFERISKGEKGLEKQARKFARENIREAQLFINHLNQRNKTLLRVANAILEFQRSFFINGPKYLTPLTLSEIARELDIHETTVSRTANGKYMQTEWGIYEIRSFFTNSISGSGSNGSQFSKESVKEIIKEIISSENRLLSDQDISALLMQRGIALARRTVAKYRKELDMGSSYTRKLVSGK